jgi:hypothetical protein
VGVNKTLEYALSEALEKGYRAGRIGNTFDEMALRERIAQEIESYIDSDSEARAFTLAADIARGNK